MRLENCALKFQFKRDRQASLLFQTESSALFSAPKELRVYSGVGEIKPAPKEPRVLRQNRTSFYPIKQETFFIRHSIFAKKFMVLFPECFPLVVLFLTENIFTNGIHL